MALLDCQIAMLGNQSLNYLTFGKVPGRMGNAHPNVVPYQAFPTADGHVIIAVGNDGQFARFCDVIARPELAANPDYASNALRIINREGLIPVIAEAMAGMETAALHRALEAADVPFGPINTIDQVFDDPQVKARGLRVDLDHPLAGTTPTVRNPIRYSDTELEFKDAPPLLGQHTESVLQNVLDLDAGEIERLRGGGVI
jgi:crotonobetainyl-CoA:carnitine CoA-transferase CaiB-like acyl-CoA transferase